jgi:multiple sugar transport system substrate-binding protein
MKKCIILTVLTMCITAILFAGGGQSAAKSGEKVTITVWTQNRGAQPTIEAQRLLYNEKNKDGNIYLEENRMFADDFGQAVNLTLQTGGEGLPDIFAALVISSSFNTPEARKDWTIDLNEWLKTHTTPADQEFNRMFSPYKVEGTTVYEGRWLVAGVASSGAGNRLVWNRDIFRKAGLPDRPPETLDEMVQFARQITTALKGEGIYGFAMNMKNPSSAYYRSLSPQIALATGLDLNGYNPATGKFSFEAEEFWLVLEAWQQLLSSDIVFPGSESLDIDPLRAQFADGKIGMYISYGLEPIVYQAGAQFPTTVDYSLAKIPVPGGVYKQKLGASINGPNIVNAKSAHLEEAWVVLRDFFYGVDTLAAQVTAGAIAAPLIPEVIAQSTLPEVYTKIPYANFQPDIDQWAGLTYYTGPWTVEGRDVISVCDEIIQNKLPRDRAMALLRDLAERQQQGLQLSIDRGEHTRYLLLNYDPLDYSKYTLGPAIPKSR